MSELTFGNSGHSRDQVVTVASRDGVRHLAAAARHAAAGIPVSLIILVVLAVIAAGLISWRQR